jgi:hypothetical protein
MNTAERASTLAEAASRFPFLGEITTAGLLALVAAELGHAGCLDDFVPVGAHLSRAMAPAFILHIVSRNTPAAGLQTLIRGLLLGSHNLCKLPTGGLPELVEFREALAPELAAKVEFSEELPDEWLEKADAVVVFGRDEVIADFRRRTRPHQTFIPHGHKLSLGIVFDDPRLESCADAARDASLFDQKGCLSPLVFYVKGDSRIYAARLAVEMERFNNKEPRGPLPPGESNSIRAAREDLQFRMANGEPISLWGSSGSTAWTVAFDGTPDFPKSPLNRFIFVKPLRPEFEETIRKERPHLSTAGIFPATIENARQAAEWGFTRVCAIGRMQFPPLTWHHDGQFVLAPLVRWVDAELG